jgi:preprotein translocase subunit SecA
MFSQLLSSIRSSVVRTIFKVSLVTPESQSAPRQNSLNYSGGEAIQQFSSAEMEKKSAQNSASQNNEADRLSPIVNEEKIGRNDPCVCGSGKKYKKCCGK